MTDDETLADVVSIHPDRDLTDDDAPISREPKPPGYCRHGRVSLNQETHRVICRDCDREVDPFAFLLTLAGDWERAIRFRKEAQRRAIEAKTRLEELLRLERNARARLKRIDPEAETPELPWGAAGEIRA